MEKAFAIAGYDKAVLEAKFGGMLKALQYGAPPHGGIAPGIDRIVMLLAGATNLRDVIMFPMNQQAQDLLMGAPSEVTPKQLRELHIRLALPDKKADLSSRPSAFALEPGPRVTIAALAFRSWVAGISLTRNSGMTVSACPARDRPWLARSPGS